MKIYDDQLIVVTGGAGFIGSGVIRHLNDKGLKNLIIVDDLGTSEKWRNLVGKSFLDIIPIGQFFSWLEGRENEIEAFIHLGACTSTTERDAGYLLENNFRFTVELADYALTNELRFIYASSAAVYGDGTNGFSDKHELISSYRPLNMYGYSKQLFDLWAQDRGVLDKVVGLRYFNVFGPNEAHKGRMASAIQHVLPSAQKEGNIRLFKSNDLEHYADGDQCRDFIYVKDAVRMTCAFLENSACGIFNIGTGKPSTWNALAESVFKAIDKPAKIEYIPMPEDLNGIYQNFTRADMSKTAGVLGQEALTDTLEDAVGDYVKNYLIPGKLW